MKLVWFALAACGAVSPQPPSRSCAGTLLEAAPPTPRQPFAGGFTWLDDDTLVAGIGGAVVGDVLDVDPRSSGVYVLDVAHARVAHVYRGAGLTNAARRRGTELLITDGNYTDAGWRDHLGVLDVVTGCLRVSEPIQLGHVAIDPAGDGFVLAREAGNERAHDTLERWDATTLRPIATRTVPRLDALDYDRDTNLVVASSWSDDVIRVRDPVTLADRGELAVDVSIEHGLRVIPGGRVEVAWQTHCTSTGPRGAMRMHCREPRIDRGVLIASLAPPAESARVVLANEYVPVAWHGERGLVPCQDETRLCEVTATGTVRDLGVAVPASWEQLTWAPDGDHYVVQGHDTIDIGSLAAGKVIWRMPLPHAP